MVPPIDLTRFKKQTAKSAQISIGFNDPTTWIDTGCYALNYQISNRFRNGGIPLEGKICMFAGDSGCLPASAKVTVGLTGKTQKYMELNVETKQVTVGELRELYHSGEYTIEIDTPDGFQPITAWFDKAKMPIFQIETSSGQKTRCAAKHLLEVKDEVHKWRHAEDIRVGDEVLTVTGYEKVTSAFNRMIEQECYDFTVNHDEHRYWGDEFSSHNSGKSYLATANVVKWCQNNNVFPVVFDTENALDESWLNKLGVKTDEDKGDMIKLQVATVDDCAMVIGDLIQNYKDQNEDIPKKDRPRMVIIIDSLGMLITSNQEKQFMEGDQKGDMGIKAKQVTAMLRVLISKIAALPIGIVLTNHVYNSQDKYTPDQIAGGMMVEFSTSVLIQMNKWMLKEDEDGKETKEITGIRSTVVVRKSRYAKPFEKVKINIPYEKGMDPYSGLFELFEKKGLFQRAGAWYSYESPATGEIFKRQGASNSKWRDVLDHIMDIWDTHYDKPSDNDCLGFDQTGITEADVANLEDISELEQDLEEKMSKKKGLKK